MSTYPFMCKYCKILDDYRTGKMILTDNKVFEYVAAIKLNMIMWDDVQNITEARLSIQYFEQDSGIDIISHDLSKVGQVKYVETLTWKSLGTFINYCDHLRNVDKLIIIIKHDTIVSPRVRSICKIVRINIGEELSKLTPPYGVVIKQLKYSNLLTNEKIDELLAYGNKPDRNTKFSNGKGMYRFWNYIIYSRKLNYAAYTKLRESDFVMKYYLKREEDEQDFQLQINSLLKYLKNHIEITRVNVLDYKLYDNFIIWRECKIYRKCEKYPWSQLLDLNILKRDYYNHLKSVEPDVYYTAKQVDELVERLENGKQIFHHNIWTECLGNDLRFIWPYSRLFEYNQVCEAYYLTTINFPCSTYEEISTSLADDEKMSEPFYV
jgi:hypothetical protein